MSIQVKALSSMEKIRTKAELACRECVELVGLAGEHMAYQLAILSNHPFQKVTIDSELKEYVTLYSVRDVPMDYPVLSETSDGDYLSTTPGPMPDLLIPLEDQNNYIHMATGITTIWVDIDLPSDIASGSYSVNIILQSETGLPSEPELACHTMPVKILDAILPHQTVKFTQWFYADCIASVHNVSIYSEEHWELIDQYMNAARTVGVNMILTPVLTPALDTAIGRERPRTQLVQIQKQKENYSFDFTLLKRWIDLCKKMVLSIMKFLIFFPNGDCNHLPIFM